MRPRPDSNTRVAFAAGFEWPRLPSPAGFLRRVGIGTRLLLAFSLVLALLCGGLLGTNLYGEWNRARLARGLEFAHQKRMLTADLEIKIGVQQLAIRTLGLAFDTVSTMKRSQQAERSLEAFDQAVRLIHGLPLEDSERALIERVAALAKEIQAPFKAATEQALVQNGFGAAELVLKEIEPRQQRQLELIKQLAQRADEAAARTSAEASAAGESASMVTLALLATALCISGVAAFATTSSVIRPLREAVHLIQQVSVGNLAVSSQPTGNDEATRLSESVNGMAQALRKIVCEVRDGATEISCAASQLAKGNADLSVRNERQASTLAETASALKRLTATVQETADNAVAAQAQVTAANGSAVVGHERFGRVQETMAAIELASQRVMGIIEVMDAMARQTSILALNAAVEAARAGEEGKGFAVVAAEVRSLAQRSTQSASEIACLIKDSANSIAGAKSLVDGAGRSMDEIMVRVGEATAIMSAICEACRVQSEGLTRVNRSMGGLDATVQQNAALVEEAAAASMHLEQQSKRLQETVRVFRLSDE